MWITIGHAVNNRGVMNRRESIERLLNEIGDIINREKTEKIKWMAIQPGAIKSPIMPFLRHVVKKGAEQSVSRGAI